jgi:hypothetical protein
MDEFRVPLVPKPWNKGKLVGQKIPLKLKEIWAIRVRLQVFGRRRELALFNLGIDSKLRACDLLKLKVRDVCHGGRIAVRAIVVQQKTSRPVQFEITESTRTALTDCRQCGNRSEQFAPVPDGRHSHLPQVFRSQVRKDLLVDTMIVKRRFVLAEAKVTKPPADFHCDTPH